MKWLLVILSIVIFSSILSAEPVIVRIPVDSQEDIELIREFGASVLNDELPGIVDVIIEEKNLIWLQQNAIDFFDMVPLSATGLLDLDPEYHTYEEFSEELQNYALNYPTLCKLDSIGHAQQFPRTIWCMKVSDNVEIEEDEIAVLYIGIHHACEVMGGETLLYMIGHFLENYGIDPQITAWIDNYEIFFVPLMNPDGHFAVIDGISEFWRKNARDLNNNGVYYQFQGGTWWTDVTEGIDLNRNYDWFWEIGGSGNLRSYYYRGDSPFSESETQAIRNLGMAQHFVCGISFHSYGEVIIYPWDYNGQPSPDQDVYDTFADELASRFIRDNGGGYSASIYGAESGQCRNWFYGVTGSLFFCVELMPYPLFTPPGSQLAERTQRYYNGSIYLLERVEGSGITGHVTDAVTGEPVYARVEIQDRISDQVNIRTNEPGYGRFTRLLNPGTYTVFAGSRGYQTARVENVVVNDTLTVVDIQLVPVAVNSDPPQYIAGVPETIEMTCSPNPFNSEVRIQINVPAEFDIELAIFDILGREAATLADGSLNSGDHTFTWNAEQAVSGIYFVRMKAGSYCKTEKLLLIK